MSAGTFGTGRREATLDSIEREQRSDGCIPWDARDHSDPWDLVEAAMALDSGGRHEPAANAYRWLAARQRSDGAWASEYDGDVVHDATLDANFSSYIAAGCWLHWLATRDVRFAHELWPTVEAAIDFALDLQAPGGEIWWARDARGKPWPAALVTSSSCIYLSLRCALALASLLGRERPDWELSLAAIERALADATASGVAIDAEEVGSRFIDRTRYAMDWYYPVLGGVLVGEAARARLAARWDELVVAERGCRCVGDRPWVTAAETCELVIALAVAGLTREAATLFTWVDHLRADDGSYWTGATFPDGVIWPRERTTWSAGAVVLAADVLSHSGPAHALFTGMGLPRPLPTFLHPPTAQVGERNDF